MANRQHLAILQNGVGAWNEWRQANPGINPDLSNASLRLTCLDKIDLHNADLASIDLYGSELRHADLQNADLHMAHLYRTDFCDADLRGATLKSADMIKSKLINAKLQGADLRWVKLGDANLRGADLTGSSVYAISAWDVTLDETTKQLNLSITRDGSPTVTVDRLEVAQFIHMLLNYKKIRDVLNSMMDKGVLILGSFKDGGIELLHGIADKLREEGYLPMIFGFESPERSDYTETIMTLASLSTFVIVELSGPSVPQELYATIPHFQIPFVSIMNNQHEIHTTFSDLLKYEWVLFPIRFSSTDELFAKFSSVIIAPALKKSRQLQAKNKEPQEKLEVFNLHKSKRVLILGSFKDGGIELLQAIAARVKEEGYFPMIFDKEKSYLPVIFDFESPERSDYTETIKILAGLSMFVIVELSGPSVPQELYATIPHFQIPFVPIVDDQHEIYATFSDFLKYDWVLFPIRFSSRDELFAKFSSEIMAPALAKSRELQAKTRETREKFDAFNRTTLLRKPKGKKLGKSREGNINKLSVQPFGKSTLPRVLTINEENINKISFRAFRKSALLRARTLTEEDYTHKNGTIQTLEGPTTFQPGDYLAVGVQNEEWPISQQHFTKTYQRLSPPDKDGFAPYRTTEIREAYQMPDAFEVRRTNGDILTGKADDYLVRTKEKVWIVDCNVFERSHELL